MLLAAAIALDGVLVDLGPARTAAYRAALAAEGVAIAPDVLARTAARALDVGDEAALRVALRDHAPALDDVGCALVVHRAERALGDRLRHGGVLLAPGAAAAVDALAGRVRLAVVTRLRRADALHLLDVAGLTPAFGAVVAGDDRGPRDLTTNRWAAAVARLGPRVSRLTPGRAVALVGTAVDGHDARAAGLRTVRVGPAGDDPTTFVALDPPDAHVATLTALTPAALVRILDLAPQPRTPSPR